MSLHKQTPYRITLLDNLARDSSYEYSRGVLEYAEHSPHWKFAGRGRVVFSSFERITPAETDGVIGWFDKAENMRELIDAGIAVVSLSPTVADSGLPCVCADDEATGRMGAEYLLERGFEHFGYFCPRGTRPLGGLGTAFQDVVERVAKRPCHLFRMSWTNRRTERPDFQRWIQERPKPIAIMAPDDRLARRIIEYTTELGLRVPDDVAVLGRGNDRWQCIITGTPMSSIDVNKREIGYLAASVLDGLLKGEQPPLHQLIPPTGVVARASTDVRLSGDPLVTTARTYIREHATQPITVSDVAAHVNASRRTLQNRMKQATGRTPKETISLERLRAAKKMLVETNGTVQQISFACGFAEQAHFSRFFKSHTGERPGEYRLRIRR